MPPHSELSAIQTSLEEVLRRVTAAAEQARADDKHDIATELFTVERSLNGALRRLGRAARDGP
jgi:hypothetical protein